MLTVAQVRWAHAQYCRSQWLRQSQLGAPECSQAGECNSALQPHLAPIRIPSRQKPLLRGPLRNARDWKQSLRHHRQLLLRLFLQHCSVQRFPCAMQLDGVDQGFHSSSNRCYLRSVQSEGYLHRWVTGPSHDQSRRAIRWPVHSVRNHWRTWKCGSLHGQLPNQQRLFWQRL